MNLMRMTRGHLAGKVVMIEHGIGRELKSIRGHGSGWDSDAFEPAGEIKVNDRVRVKSAAKTTRGQDIDGRVFRVAAIIGTDCFGLDGVPGDHYGFYSFSSEHLEIVAHDEPEAPGGGLMRLKHSMRVVLITSEDGNLKTARGIGGPFHTDSFEPIGRIKIGDRVKIKSSARADLIGKVYAVARVDLTVVALVGLGNYTFDEQKLEIVAFDEPLSEAPSPDHYEGLQVIRDRDQARDVVKVLERENASLKAEIVNLKNDRNTVMESRNKAQDALKNSQATLNESEAILAKREAGVGKLKAFLVATKRYEWVEGFPKDDPVAEAQWRIEKLEGWCDDRTKDLDIARKATALESEHVMRLKLKAYEGPPPKPGLLSRLFDDFAIGFGALSAAASIVGSALKRFWGPRWQRSWLKPDRYESTIEQIGGTMAVSLALMLTALMFCSPMAFYYDHYVWSVERAADAIVVPAPPRQDDPRERALLEARAARRAGHKWL